MSGRRSRPQRDEIASWSARMVANVIGVKKPPWMELDQWVETLAQNWSSVDPEEQHERVDCHQGTSAQPGQVMLPEWTTQKSVRRP